MPVRPWLRSRLSLFSVPRMRLRTIWVACAPALLVTLGCSVVPQRFQRSGGDLRASLTFHASFDRGADADFAAADPWIYHAPAMDEWKEERPGLPPEGGVGLLPGEGRVGGALGFQEPGQPVVYYHAFNNVPWTEQNWSGTVSFWLRASLAELPEGFCDPIQITPRGWNDAALFVEFEKREERVVFRFGAYPDYRVWNPLNRDWEEFKPQELPLVSVEGPPFRANTWTHVAFTWQRFNTGKKDGVAVLYLDGAHVGAITGREMTFRWKPSDARLLLGVGFVGWIDDVAVFNRALTQDEIRRIRQLPRGIRSLLQDSP
jgi:hypothetical protein